MGNSGSEARSIHAVEREPTRLEFLEHLLPESYARAQKEGVKFETTIDLKGQPRYLKAVVYDYAADKLGSAVVEIR